MSNYKAVQRKQESAIKACAEGKLVFQSTFINRDGQRVAPSRSAKAIRDGKLNKKSGRRLATKYI